ncbi:MAG: undecaprenyl/decaprenyl-phosphate alpha-N-acetylglucosaminyl 1-phosphate transferase [Chitinophagales bacterium]|nr:undecaprenyl/decaprenyl-phosphate alpha-N-acetylglucosaminyl 1-phosphate transferase [Chitinophagales bacterium]
MHSDLIKIVSALLTSFVLTYMFIPSIIKVANIKHLFDTPGGRKSHVQVTPTLGGIGIFGGFMISLCLFSQFYPGNGLRYILAALCFTFMLGAKDDIVELVASKKFIGQIFAASIVVILGDIRLTSLYGMFGISYIHDVFSIVLSIVTIIFIINAFNIIDGINLLAGSISIVMSLAFGAWFYYYGFFDYAILAAAMSGAVFAFLKYNYTPAKIFMGDSGSLSIGLMSAILAIQFIEKNEMILLSGKSEGFEIVAAPAMAIAVLIIPVYDTLRVFTLRIINKKSPFMADRNHIHHRLIDLGLTHIQATFVLIGTNLFFIAIAYFLQGWGNLYLILTEFLLATVLTYVLFAIPLKRNNDTQKISHKKVNLKLETKAG